MRPITTLTANDDHTVQMELADSQLRVELVRFVPPVLLCVTMVRDCECDSTALANNRILL